jgi:DNA polymerase-3 subunit delta
MRYQSVKAFQKHLANAAPHNLCRLYLIAIADDFERAKALDAILSYLPSSPTRFSGGDCNLRDVLDAMQSFSLFGETPVVVCDEVEQLAKKEMQTLCDHLRAPAGYVLFGARSKTLLVPLIEQEGVILDLLEEKPWEKEKRLVEQLAERAKSSGKKLSNEGASLLLERLGTDPALLESEIDKLICYVGERGAITREDILLLTPASRTATLWQTAEEVVWEGEEFPPIDATAFHTLIPALRSQLHIGLALATLIEEKRPSDQWSRSLPKLWPKTLEKRSSQAARLGSAFFRRGLEKLFDLELISRASSTQYRALLDLFRAELYAR